VDPSWFLALFLFIWWLTDSYQDPAGAALSGNTAFFLAVITTLLFFASILLHELGHAVVSIRNRIPILGIDLWLFGGIAKMTRDTTSPGVEFRVAIAGPLVTLAIALLCASIRLAAGGAEDFGSALLLQADASSSGFIALLSWLTSINLLLLFFNLVPAFPLDGGRIARSIVWKATGDRTRATRVTAGLGQGFAYILIGLGVFMLVSTGDLLGGFWLVFIGLFLGQAARTANYQTAVLSKIEGVTVHDVMDREPVAIPSGATVGQALEEYFLRYRFPWFPVVDAGGRFIGVLDRETVERVGEHKRPVFKVDEVMRAAQDGQSVRSDEALEALLGSEPLARSGALMAVDPDGRLTGIVTWDQVRRALQQGVAETAQP
jgi:Zn-dependent protease